MSVRTDVSILLPVYNVESYIKACIESIILHQSQYVLYITQHLYML